MSNAIVIGEQHFIPAREAGKLVNYRADYISKLAREGKIEATRVGGKWYVSPESTKAFFKEMEESKKARSEELRRERKAEQQRYQEEIGEKDVVETHHGKVTALVETFVIVFLGIAVGMTGYASVPASGSVQQAGVFDSGLSVLEHVALRLYTFFTPTEVHVYVAETATKINKEPVQQWSKPGADQEEEHAAESLREGLFVISPDVSEAEYIESIKAQFSDEVEVTLQEGGSRGEIVPIFRERRGETYRFITVPMVESKAGANESSG